MLLDRDDYWLNSEYAQWTTDPNDPEVKRAREERKNVKPPPHPIIAPVALRPKDMAEIRRKQYMEALLPKVQVKAEKKLTAREFAQMMGA
ncbi:hypothetical protein K3M35_05090 [Rhodococcus sp. DMU2021]|uniref:hypothetical protein n=1 Tax=Rhodococcus sp. DMU2021 TaxID=2866997 RepID=UPI001C7DB8A2|nr:hypothetical protein [Rhodococcus sp. DMU2021]MBX4168041.1 hypothetical protein [Rhodococcus sp. DMU2021]